MTQGIHHITAIASDAKRCVVFYTGTLGLRLVKKSVNQDDTGTYHLFFGDRLGHPGMDLTFFILLPPATGVQGNGLVTNISLAVPVSSLSFWSKRFDTLGVRYTEVIRFGHTRVAFTDPDGLPLELVGVPDYELGETDVYVRDGITKEHAVRNFYSASLRMPDPALAEPVLTKVFGYTATAKEKNVHEYSIGKKGRAIKLEITEDVHSPWGIQGAGTVHHIAFRAKDEAEQMELRSAVVSLGLSPTDVIDRFYFRSVYFRTPSRILFEIATDAPGFTADEPEGELGKHLALPPFLEEQRIEIEKNLIKID